MLPVVLVPIGLLAALLWAFLAPEPASGARTGRVVLVMILAALLAVSIAVLLAVLLVRVLVWIGGHR